MIMLALIALLSPRGFAAAPQNVIYEVPAPDSLKPYATVAILYEITRGPAYATSVRYTLPATLLGKARTFELAGAENPATDAYDLKGIDAEMHCEAGAVNVTCRVTHHDVAIDLTAVKAALDASDFPQAEKEGRFQLATFLSRAGGDLVGVLTFPPEL